MIWKAGGREADIERTVIGPKQCGTPCRSLDVCEIATARRDNTWSGQGIHGDCRRGVGAPGREVETHAERRVLYLRWASSGFKQDWRASLSSDEGSVTVEGQEVLLPPLLPSPQHPSTPSPVLPFVLTRKSSRLRPSTPTPALTPSPPPL